VSKLIQFLLFIFLIPVFLFSQSGVNDSINLPEFEFKETRLNDFSTALKVNRIDSIVLKQNSLSSLSEILLSQSPIFIKTYGSGSLATLSFRGTTANHTGIFWNGFSIEPPNIGMTDLSLIPITFFESVEIQHGGSSSLFGSGNIGGSIHLENNFLLNSENKYNFSVSSGSFGTYSGKMKVLLSDKKWSASSGIMIRKMKNDFSFKNIYGENEKQKNAELFQYGIFQDYFRKITKKQLFSIAAWFQFSDPEIPRTLTSRPTNAYQIDRAFRTNAQWKKFINAGSISVKAAYFDEFLHYVDKTGETEETNIDSKISMKSFISEFDFKKSVFEILNIAAGISLKTKTGEAESYQGLKKRREAAIFFSSVINFSKIKWSAALNLRQEFIEEYDVPLTPSLGFEGKIWKNILGRINISRNFRAPTLNDRFWIPGGNENLKPENSWNEEIGLSFNFSSKNKKHFSEFSITAYNSMIDDMIMWIPKQNFWSVDNVQKVWARGVELQGKTNLKIKELEIIISEAYTYSKSTYQKKLDENDETYQKQLIYTPLHNVSAQLQVIYNKWSISYNHNWVGKVFTSRDNLYEIPSYSIASFNVIKNFEFDGKLINLKFNINNIFDKDYQVIKYRPMPGRSFEITLNLEF